MREITFKDTINDLKECIEASDRLGLLYSIVKKNIGSEDKPVYVLYFYLNI